jgi:hypothetical protein
VLSLEKNSALLAVTVAIACAGARAGDARPDVPWDTIEDWALGDQVSISIGGKTEPKPDPKVLTSPAKPEGPKPEPGKEAPPPATAEPRIIPPPKSTSRRAEPRDFTEYKAKFLQRAVQRLTKADADRNYEQCFDIAYKMENYGKAMEALNHMREDKRLLIKENWYRDTDVWIAGKMCETGLMSGQLQAAALDTYIKTWKDKALKAVDDMKQNGFGRNDVWRDAAGVQRREDFYRNYAAVVEENKKMELAGEDNAKFLAELGFRLWDEGRPTHALRYLSILLKLREWFPDFDHVKNGEVQVRIARVLSNDFGLYREAADEATVAQEKFQSHAGVASGEICWIIADNWQKLANEQKTNREALEYFKQSKTYYEMYQRKYGSAANNKPGNGPGNDNRTECQKRLDDVNKGIATRAVRNQ